MDSHSAHYAHSLPQNLLVTKLDAPIYPLDSVRRTRLTDRLKKGMELPLTLVIAPAGYGKTLLLLEWATLVESAGWSIAWLRLDKEDNDLQFWSYFVGALQTLDAGLCSNWRQEQATVWTPDTVNYCQINALLNQIAAIPVSFSLILDDYQEIQAEDIHNSLAYLIDHMPRNMHLVIASRSLPPIQLARLRARGQLTEILASELAFNRQETEIFLTQVMKVEAEAEDISTLMKVTEGWIAGLKMAVLSFENGRGLKSLLADFTGSNRHIMDFLTEEVISQQSDEIRNFLIKTSIFSKMTAALCDDVLGLEDSQGKLEYLEQVNLFIVPLDKQRRWYRYHALFADYLRLSLERLYSEQIPRMHWKACTWLENSGYPEQAIPHAIACGDFEKAATDIESCIMQYFLRSDLFYILQWAERLPKDVFQNRPRLAFLIILAYVVLGQRSEIEKPLKELIGIVDQPGDTEHPTSLDLSLHKQSLVVHAMTACLQSDYEKAMEVSKQTLATLDAEDYCWAGMLSHFAHYAYLALGRLDEAAETLKSGIRISLSHGLDLEYLSSMCALGRIYKYRGWLHEAAKVFQEALDYAYKRAVGLKTISFIQAGLSDIYREWDQLDLASQYLQGAQAYFSRYETGFLDWNFAPDFSMILARNRILYGDFEAIGSFLEAAKAFLIRYFKIPFLSAQIKSVEVRYWLASGDLSRAARWSAEMQARLSSPEEHISVIETIALARADLALGRAKQAVDLLLELSSKEAKFPLVEYQIELKLIKALALYQLGERAGAEAAVISAIKLGEPDGYMRIFIDEGQMMKTLLSEVLEDIQKSQSRGGDLPPLASYIKTILIHFSFADEKNARPPVRARPQVEVTEPLSDREKEILKLLADGLNSRQISTRLFISLNTTRTHIKKIYQKLDAHNRAEAIERAILINLL